MIYALNSTRAGFYFGIFKNRTTLSAELELWIAATETVKREDFFNSSTSLAVYVDNAFAASAIVLGAAFSG